MNGQDTPQSSRLRPIGGTKLETTVVLVVYLVGIMKGVADAAATLEGTLMLLAWTIVWSLLIVSMYVGWIAYTELLGRIWYGGGHA
jgi:hypothetical protein